MKRFRKALSVLALAGVSVAAWFGASSIVSNVQFAHAEQRVELSREQLQSVQDLSGAFREVAKVVEPSVVKIEVRKTVKMAQQNLPFDPDFLRRFFPNQNLNPNQNGDDDSDSQEQEMLQMGEGSGVIVDADGGTAYILTNNHVAGGASELHVTLSDGREISNVKVVGTDPKSDLAVLSIPASNVIAAHWGDSNALQQGDMIFAFGSPFGYVGSMTHGIVSALHRQRIGIIGSEFAYENFIQVDAPINPGNSGGPLVNMHGDLVGINTAIATNTRSFAGIGFAIPSNEAKTIYEQLRQKGKVVRGWLGVEIGDVAIAKDEAKALGFTGDHGVIVASTMTDAPATGVLHAGDIITAINGKDVQNATDLRNEIATIAPDTEVKLTIFRDKKSQDVTVKVGEQPADLLSRATQHGAQRGEGEAESTSADKLGIRLVTPNDELTQRFGLGNTAGALITGVQPGSPGAMAGLRAGDLITHVGDKPVTTADEAMTALNDHDLKAGVRIYVTNKTGDRLVFIKTSK